MAKRTKFQAELLLRPQPPNAFDVLRETAARLEQTNCFPPGVIPMVGITLNAVLAEVDEVRAQKAADKEKPKLAVAESPGLTA